MQEGGVKKGGQRRPRACYRIRKEMRADAGTGSQPVHAGLRSCPQGARLVLGCYQAAPTQGASPLTTRSDSMNASVIYTGFKT